MQLTKHHGLGNDFLVLLDLDGRQPVDAAAARALCDRRRGVGADGLLRATRPPAGVDAGVAMELFNADGSTAEISGNGIRCLAQAVVDAGIRPEGELVVATGAGLRRLEVGPETEAGLREVRVDMGPAVEIAAAAGAAAAGAGRAMAVSLGNPHLVLLHDDAAAVAAAVGGPAEVNVEHVLAGPGPDAITIRIVERGVGETLACGSGACAAAYAAHEWGLVGPVVTVHQPGGDAVVELKPDTTVLTGPTRFVARIEVPAP